MTINSEGLPPEHIPPRVVEAVVEAAETADRPYLVRELHPLSIHVLAPLIPGSIFGALTRLGLQGLTNFEGSAIFPLAYVQSLGCFIMGFTLGFKQPISRFYQPLYIGITTGYCGSLTTFSGWQLDIFKSWLNASNARRSGFDSFVNGLGLILFTFSLSLGSLVFGTFCSEMLSKHPRWRPQPILQSPPRQVYAIVFTVVCILMYGATLPCYFLLPDAFRHQATAALLFAFPGTLIRYLFSLYLNPLSKALPTGTFAANMLATSLLGMFFVLQNVKAHPVSPNACAILQGLADGFCGCLSTISTFAVEIYTLTHGKGVRYAVLSWGGGQILLLIILGASIWTGNASKQATCTFATG